MAKRKAVQKLTLEEFKAWIQGIEAFQPADWVPTKEQWANIRKHIDAIIVEEKVVEEPAYRPSQMPQMPPSGMQPPPGPPPAVVPDNPGMMAPPIVPSSIPPVDVEISPAAKEMLSGNGNRKTPDVDASQGPVASSFE